MAGGVTSGTLVRVKDQTGPVVIDGDVVRRPAGPWTPAVHALLDHLERAGFAGSPHAVSTDGADVVTYIPGEPVHPHAWSDEGVFEEDAGFLRVEACTAAHARWAKVSGTAPASARARITGPMGTFSVPMARAR